MKVTENELLDNATDVTTEIGNNSANPADYSDTMQAKFPKVIKKAVKMSNYDPMGDLDDDMREWTSDNHSVYSVNNSSLLYKALAKFYQQNFSNPKEAMNKHILGYVPNDSGFYFANNNTANYYSLADLLPKGSKNKFMKLVND